MNWKAWPMVPALVLTVKTSAGAEQTVAPSPGWRIGAEVDPVPFFEHGLSFHAAVKPSTLPRLRFTLGVFALTTTPSAGSTNEGWTSKQRAMELSASYFLFDEEGRGLFAGLYAFIQRFSYTRSDLPGEVTAYWVTPAPAVGFQWLPWKWGPYVTPWAALGLPLRSGERQLDGHTYEEPKVFPVLALHVGYEFGL
jgi:hypothetical protein